MIIIITVFFGINHNQYNAAIYAPLPPKKYGKSECVPTNTVQ